MADELRACPFCGSKSVRPIRIPDSVIGFVECFTCGGNGPIVTTSDALHPFGWKQEAIDAYNRRQADDTGQDTAD